MLILRHLDRHVLENANDFRAPLGIATPARGRGFYSVKRDSHETFDYVRMAFEGMCV
jgi:aspartyl/asparaginyl beta-hydroxylase (cupin superfamily)